MSRTKARGLGRGLDSLFEDIQALGENSTEEERAGGQVVSLSIDLIKPNARQPRKEFDKEKISELAESIRAHGVLQPIMVRRADKGYEIVAGERRWRAAREAGLKEVPGIVREMSDEQVLLVAIIENLQREDLNPLEEAAAFQDMISSFGLTQEEVAKSVGKSRPYVTNALRLLRLPKDVQGLLTRGSLSAGHARALAAIRDEKLQLTAARRAADEGWSVRQTELFAGEKRPTQGAGRKKPRSREKSREILDLQEALREILGTKISIENGVRGGRIVIEYYSREELERLLELLQTLK
ncbi:MAG: ParB/RepB/Spo0J family partition protein [Bacillota bacterium]|nr:ParB/RepB/Spo0J family partition protein [Bacillota bacterium]